MPGIDSGDHEVKLLLFAKLNQSIEAKRLMRGYPAEDMIVYPAAGEEKTRLTEKFRKDVARYRFLKTGGQVGAPVTD